jgi:hypothetical protein
MLAISPIASATSASGSPGGEAYRIARDSARQPSGRIPARIERLTTADQRMWAPIIAAAADADGSLTTAPGRIARSWRSAGGA